MIIIKTPEQIEGIRKSCKLAAETLQYVGGFVRSGVTTEELDQAALAYMIERDAVPAPLNYHGFPKSICTSINEVICHGIPDQTELRPGDIVNVDITTILDGYYGDTSAMFPVGHISPKAHSLIETTKACLIAGMTQVKPEAEFGSIGKIITSMAEAFGYSVVHQFCGHGTGIKFHEDPQVCHHYRPEEYDRTPMKPGMIFTIEPMINLGVAEAVIDKGDGWTARTADGSLSAQFEHTVLVTEKGVEVLTCIW